MKERCNELEDLEKKGRADLLYAKVRELTKTEGKGNSQCCSIKDNNVDLLIEPEKFKERWKEYVEELYDREGKPTNNYSFTGGNS